MSIKVKGNCHCGDVQISAQLSRPAPEFEPRKCDCSFCVKHGASYLSDPDGAVEYKINPHGKLTLYRQTPDGAAEFMICAKCGILVGVLYKASGGGLYSTMNSNIFDQVSFGNVVSVSPQKLPREERIARWEQIWFSNVKMFSL